MTQRIFHLSLITLFLLLLSFTGVFKRPDMGIYDLYNAIFKIPADTNIVIVSPETTILTGEEICSFESVMDGNSVIGIDLPLTPEDILVLNQCITRNTLVLPVFFLKTGMESLVRNKNLCLAHNEVLAEDDGIVRAIAPFRIVDERAYPAFGLEVFLKSKNIPVENILLKRDRLIVGKTTIYLDRRGFAHFRFTDGNYRTVPFEDAIKKGLKGEYILMGYTDLPFSGQFFTPINHRGEPVPGVIIHAQFIDAIVNNRFIRLINPLFTFFLFSVIFISFLQWNRKSRYSLIILSLSLLIHPILFVKWNIYFYITPILVYTILTYAFYFYSKNLHLILMIRRLRAKAISSEFLPSPETLLKIGLITGFEKEGKVYGEKKGFPVRAGKWIFYTEHPELKEILKRDSEGEWMVETVEEILEDIEHRIERREEIADVTEHAPFPFLILSGKGFIYLNRHFRSLLEKDRDKLKDIIVSLVKNKQIATEKEIDGRIYSINGFYHPSGFYFLTLYDIDEITRTSRVRKLYTSWFSHQARTPLTTIKGFAELQVKEGVKFSREILRETERLSNLANKFLNFARLDEGSFQVSCKRIPIKKMVEEIVESFKPLMEHFRVRVDTEIQCSECISDPVLIKEILSNLIENAIKYNRPDGRVKVSIEESRDGWNFTIEDTGTGLPENKTFTPFSPSKKGYGLGLSLVQKCVEALNGKLEFKTGKEGTTFTLFIPVCQIDSSRNS